MIKKEKTKKKQELKKIAEKNEQQVSEMKKAEQEAKEEQKGTQEEMVTIPLNDYAAQLEEIDQLKSKVDEYSDGWQRERADFDNYRKRIQRDQDQQRQNNKIDIIQKYLVIQDDLELALNTVPNNEENQNWVEGITLILNKLKKILDEEGIQPIPAGNAKFDPTLHEAISNEDNPDFESGQIIEVLKQGYTIGDRVIRPTQVRVAK
ncbi:MAG TPA: nucleotide exchange factor GrpE [Anaerolineae bacterium]|nr:nucleotide exchange factor GrpE [Anaerolineae bacterium]